MKPRTLREQYADTLVTVSRRRDGLVMIHYTDIDGETECETRSAFTARAHDSAGFEGFVGRLLDRLDRA